MSALETLIRRTEHADGTGGAEGQLEHVWHALVRDEPITLTALYQLSYEEFNLVLEAIREWRFQRYVYAGCVEARADVAPASPYGALFGDWHAHG